MQKVVSVGACWISQIDHGNIVAVTLGDVAVVTHDVTFGIGRQETHPAGTGILNAGVEPEGGFADAGRADHQHVDVAGVYHRRGITCTSNDDALRKRFAIFACGSFTVLGLLPPFLRREWNMLIDLTLFAFGHPAGGSMLAVADCLGFDVVEVIDVCKYRDGTEHHKHHDGYDD